MTPKALVDVPDEAMTHRRRDPEIPKATDLDRSHSVKILNMRQRTRVTV